MQVQFEYSEVQNLWRRGSRVGALLPFLRGVAGLQRPHRGGRDSPGFIANTCEKNSLKFSASCRQQAPF